MDEKTVIGLMRAFAEERAKEKQHRELKADIDAQIRPYIAERGPVVDEETGLRGWMDERKGATVWDVASLPDELVLWAARHGCLKVDGAVLKALDGKFIETVDINKVAMPGPTSTVMHIERERSE